ncbi:transposase [Streptomyces sp. NWU339]|uniref:transposase n=1 Tax=Streptomyces sp. NWU339 TaxID=2185284 RepID=UPI0015E7F39A|nr:transposase [Streptomyces sp. NWU339]
MAKGFRVVERDQQFLLPPDMREWLPEEHLAWFVLDAVAALSDGCREKLRSSYRLGGVGRQAYDPEMLLALLIYAYAGGVRSSRKIERLCTTDVAFKVICGLRGPDHTTIARFRAERLGVVEELFAEVLRLCARAGLGRLGEVALDGTKIAANASLQATHGREWFAKQARELLEQAERTDAEESTRFGRERGDELPAGLARRADRLARLRRGIAEIEAEEAARATASEQVGARTAELLRGGRLAGRAADRVRRSMDRRAWLEVRLEAIGAQIERAGQRLDGERQAWEQARAEGRPLTPHTFRVHDARKYLRRRLAAFAEVGQELQQRQGGGETAREPLPGAPDAGSGQPDEEAPRAGKVKRNATDPDSRVMPVRHGGWVQGYNVQVVALGDGVIAGIEATNDPIDVHQLAPMLARLRQIAPLLVNNRPVSLRGEPIQRPGRPAHGFPVNVLPARAADAAAVVKPDKPVPKAELGLVNSRSVLGLWVSAMLMDAGYLSLENLTLPGPNRLIATGRQHSLQQRAAAEPAQGPPPADADPIRAMDHRLRTPHGAAAHRRRGPIAETPNAQLKELIGLRRFARRGLQAVQEESLLAALTLNLLTLFRTAPDFLPHKTRTATG